MVRINSLMDPDHMDVMRDEYDLSAEQAQKTGYKKAVIMISENFKDKSRRTCAFPKITCIKPAVAFERTAIAVIDKNGQEIPYKNLPAEVQSVLDEVRLKVGLCYEHLMDAHLMKVI